MALNRKPRFSLNIMQRGAGRLSRAKAACPGAPDIGAPLILNSFAVRMRAVSAA
jgi:hypothetical protein